MKTLLKATVAAIALLSAGASLAADLRGRGVLPPAPELPTFYNWSGVYIGGHAGGGQQRNCWISSRSTVGSGPSPGPASTSTGGEGCHRDTDVVSGGQVGVNWQSGPVVLGAEASGSWSNLKGSGASGGFPLFTNETRTDAIGLFTGRLGVAWNNALIYVKGGAAWTNNEYRSFPTTSPAALSTARDTRWGWTAGGGFEYGFAPRWSVAVEYDFIDTGAESEVFPSGTVCGTTPCTSRIDQHIHMATLRLNYRFASWGAWH